MAGDGGKAFQCLNAHFSIAEKMGPFHKGRAGQLYVTDFFGEAMNSHDEDV